MTSAILRYYNICWDKDLGELSDIFADDIQFEYVVAGDTENVYSFRGKGACITNFYKSSDKVCKRLEGETKEFTINQGGADGEYLVEYVRLQKQKDEEGLFTLYKYSCKENIHVNGNGLIDRVRYELLYKVVG